MTIEEFNSELISCDSAADTLQFVKRNILHGTPVVFTGRENEYFEFRSLIANKLGVGFHEVFIIGSAKLGFSFFKKTAFSYESDVDVVIVNERLFEEYYLKITDYQYELDKNHKVIDAREKIQYNRFLQYLVKGWMRPDLLPTSFQIELLRTEWFDFFESISYKNSTAGNYKIAAGLYKNYTYLEKYHHNCIQNFYNNLTINKNG